MYQTILNVINNISLFNLMILLVLIVIIIFIYEHRNYGHNYWKSNGIPGPKPMPIFGNTHSYFIKSMPEVELEWYQKYGKLYGIYNGSNPTLTVAEPELVKQILVKDFNIFRNRMGGTSNHPVVSKNLLSVRDDDWKRIRSIVSPTFSTGNMKKMHLIIKECCDDFIANLDQYATNRTEIEIERQYGEYLMNVIARCAFGTNIDAHTNPQNEFMKNAMACFKAKQWKMILLSLMPRIVSRLVIVRRLLATTVFCEFFINVGRHLIKQRKDSSSQYKDFLQLLIDSEISDFIATNESKDDVNLIYSQKEEIRENMTHMKLSDTLSQKKLTENEILAQCLLFFIAGYGPATTLTFCTYELALSADIQRELYQELSNACDSDGCIEYDTLLKLPYLDAVICETLRKYPPGLRADRIAMSSYALGDTGFTIPKGTAIEIAIYAMHYDPQYFPDPHIFNPERFMPENRSEIKPYTYLPFGTGPRHCVAMRFALLEMKLAVANIIRRFELFKTPNTDIQLKYTKGKITLQPKNGVFIGIRRRNAY